MDEISTTRHLKKDRFRIGNFEVSFCEANMIREAYTRDLVFEFEVKVIKMHKKYSQEKILPILIAKLLNLTEVFRQIIYGELVNAGYKKDELDSE